MKTEDPLNLAAGLLPKAYLTGPDTAEAAGIDHDLAERFWHAVGMPRLDKDTVAFSEADVDALIRLRTMLEAGYPIEDLITTSRLVGRAMSRISDAHSRSFRDRLVGPLLAAGPNEAGQAAVLVRHVVDLVAPLMEYSYRRHIDAALQNLVLSESDELSEKLAAGFTDLVAFSKLVDELQESELSNLIERFEAVVMDVCVESGVRLVKIVGDSALFVSSEPVRALQAALAILERVQADEILPDARAGLDYGAVVPRAGDYFGRPVNVASRITDVARPGTLVASEEFVEALPEGEVELSRMKAQRLKNVGRVSLFRLRPFLATEDS